MQTMEHGVDYHSYIILHRDSSISYRCTGYLTVSFENHTRYWYVLDLTEYSKIY